MCQSSSPAARDTTKRVTLCVGPDFRDEALSDTIRTVASDYPHAQSISICRNGERIGGFIRNQQEARA